MGTNYYITKNGPSVADPIHIGKSSVGWMFHFQSQRLPWHDPPLIWNTYEQVKQWLYDNTVADNAFVIMNEYGEIVPYEKFIDLVEYKQNDPFCRDNPGNFDGKYVTNVNGYRFSE